MIRILKNKRNVSKNKQPSRIPRATKLGLVLAGTLAASAAAHAQSNVTLYGILSVGVVYTNNATGHSQTQMMSGPQQNPRFGIRGTEDLGSGLSALFVLENGFSMTNGAALQGGRMFGRQAYVGLSSRQMGTVTFGRQYDEVAHNTAVFQSGVVFGAFGAHVGDNDNIFNTFRLNNSARYESPDIHGLQFAGQYAFSNAAGNFSGNSAWSVGSAYKLPSAQFSAAYTKLRYPEDPENLSGAVDNNGYGLTSPFLQSPVSRAAVNGQGILATAASYTFGTWTAAAIYSNTSFSYLDHTGLRLQNFEVSLRKFLTPAFLVGAGYVYTMGKYNANDEKLHYHQVNLGTDYFLSKRTDVYLDAIYQRAGGGAQVAQIFTLSPSTSKSQLAVILGMRHKF